MTNVSMLDAIQYVGILLVGVMFTFATAGWLWDQAVAAYLRRRERQRRASMRAKATVMPMQRKDRTYKRPRGAA